MLNENFELSYQGSQDEARELLAGIGKRVLMTALQQLSSTELEVVDIAFGLGVGVVQFRSVDDYLKIRDIDRSKFKAMRERTLRKLRNSLEMTLIAQTGQVGAE